MSNHYDRIYSHRIYELRHPGDMLKDEIIFELTKDFKQRTKTNVKTLEIGCGMGHTSQLLSKVVPILIGIDISREGIKIAKERVNADFIVGDCTSLPFKDESFDCIVMKDVLEHIKNDSQAIDEAYRVLKKNGLLILYVPYSLDDCFSFESIIKKLFGFTIDDKVGHVRRYDLKEIKTKLKNFKIIKYFYFAHFLFGVVSVFGIIINDMLMKRVKTENKRKKTKHKTLIGLIIIGLKLLKILGKIEYMLLRNKLKGAGIFVIAKKL